MQSIGVTQKRSVCGSQDYLSPTLPASERALHSRTIYFSEKRQDLSLLEGRSFALSEPHTKLESCTKAPLLLPSVFLTTIGLGEFVIMTDMELERGGPA